MNKWITYFLALVWFVNGLFCKLLNFVPRHQQIVGRILGDEYAWMLTKTIGVLELLMVVWILSGIQSRLCAIAQMVIVFTMVGIEIFLTPDLLLFGRANAIPALLLIGLIFFNEFELKNSGKARNLMRT